MFELQAHKVMAGMVVTRVGAGNTLAVTSTSQLRRCRFGSRNRQLEAFRFAHGGDGRRATNSIAGEQAVQVVDAVHRLSIERHDDVARLQARTRRRTAGLDRRDQHGCARGAHARTR